MSHLMTRRLTLSLTGAALAAPFIASPAFAATQVVEMLSVNPENPRQRFVFSPRVTVVNPGDTVRFVPTDPGHNSVSIAGMLPDGASGWSGAIGQEVSATLNTSGIYGYQCQPHASVGMVGVVIVSGPGALGNLDAAQAVRQRGQARAIFEEIWAEVAALGL